MATTVARIKNLSSQDIKECIRKSTPMIATDMMKSWKASTQWSFDFLKERYGSDVVTLSDGRFRALAQLAGALYRLDSPNGPGRHLQVLGRNTLHTGLAGADLHPELNRDIEVPEWFDNWERPFKKTFRPSVPYHDIVVLVGPAGATTYVHRDRHRTHAWLAQIAGRKRWTIFSPDQYSLLYNKNCEPGAPSFVNIVDPDLENFPRFKDASPIEFVLYPGELVFMPSGWLHQVTSLDPTLSISGNFVNGSNIGVFVRDACRAILENFQQRRRRLPPQLAQSLSELTQAIEGGKLISSPLGPRSQDLGKAATCG